jgi:flavin-dependent dehydrogenase
LRIEADAAVVTTAEGEFRAQVVCDASGRWTSTSALQRQRRVHPSHRKVSCFGHFRGVRRCERHEGNIIIVRFGDTEKGWFWLIPFADGTTSVGVVAEVDYFRRCNMSAGEFFEQSIRDSRHMAPRMVEAQLCGEYMSEADFSYTSDRHVGDRLIKVGDAGAFVDPIFSSGILLSTRAADMAADAIDDAFRANDFNAGMFTDYEARVRRGTKVFWSFIDAFYNKDFLRQMVTSRRRPLLQKSITSLLAGDIYNPNNQLITYLTGDGGVYADHEVKQLLG